MKWIAALIASSCISTSLATITGRPEIHLGNGPNRPYARVETICDSTYWTSFSIVDGRLIDKSSCVLGATLSDYVFEPIDGCNLRSPVECHGDTLFVQQIVLHGTDVREMAVVLMDLLIPVEVEVYLYSPEQRLLGTSLTSRLNTSSAWPLRCFPAYPVNTIIFQIQAPDEHSLLATSICIESVSCLFSGLNENPPKQQAH